LYYGGEVLRDYIYVDDVCSAINVCLRSAPTNQIINIGSGKPYKFLDLLEYTIEKCNSKSNIIYIEPSKFHNIVQVRHSYLNTTKIKSYGFKQQYTMENTLDKLIDFYQKQK
jgi:dTDP-glucose 4,6-dehydratase